MRHPAVIVSIQVVLACGVAAGADDPYAPPAGYYDGVAGTGAALQASLGAAMTAGHIQRTYGDFRTASRFFDTDPNDPTRILLAYNRASVSAAWDSGATWNREHVWPESRQPGSVSNSTRGNLGDPHSLRPCNPSINSSRGNKPFGFEDSTGPHGSVGSYYFPGDVDKGDIARSLFYSETRYGPSTGIMLVDSFPSGNQMGGLSSLVAWHYLDPPDGFERRRNHAVFSQQMNPAFYTNNRNAFVDLPETVWSVFVDQFNDTTLWLGDAPAVPGADGGSAVHLTLNALVGQELGPASVVLNRAGQDGTYFEVRVTGPVATSLTGRHNAFAIGGWDNTRLLEITPAPGLTDQPGAVQATVVIDNLDVTTGAGAGMGAQDADDTLLVEIGVYQPAEPSFDPSETVTELLIDLGEIAPGSGDAAAAFDLFNLAPAGPGAPMDVDLVSAIGDTDSLAVSFTPVVSLPAGDGELFVASLSDDAEGDFEAVYTFRAFNDRGLFAQPGPGTDLVLRLTGTVGAGVCAPDLAAPFGTLNFFDVAAYMGLYTGQQPAADLNGDGQLNFFDVSAYMGSFNAGCP